MMCVIIRVQYSKNNAHFTRWHRKQKKKQQQHRKTQNSTFNIRYMMLHESLIVALFSLQHFPLGELDFFYSAPHPPRTEDASDRTLVAASISFTLHTAQKHIYTHTCPNNPIIAVCSLCLISSALLARTYTTLQVHTQHVLWGMLAGIHMMNAALTLVGALYKAMLLMM